MTCSSRALSGTAISSNYRDEKKCGSSYYRCLRILVSYYANGKKQTAYLYENVNAQKNKCSTQPCSSSEWSNDLDVESFRRDYGKPDSAYTCYYNPKTLDEVFTIRSSVMSDQWKVVNGILWPLLLVVFSLGMLGTLFCRAKGRCCYKKRNGSSVQYQNLQPRA
ncbi:hypothetical protein OS493_012588 [Desmophyllum pertusum]|uniref:Uncharacterized protein n=1 Tax=Desmophyllum pertusum TaxID=174260 RepID=A0A9W9ZGZ6_9CNID|nr:hypothetical protein OS493_012588 [Desmophyllum pertusum]